MKRHRNDLLRDRTEAEVDARTRRGLYDAALAEERRERVRQVDKARIDAMRKNIEKWEHSHISVASDLAVTEPQALPLGTSPPPNSGPNFPTLVSTFF